MADNRRLMYVYAVLLATSLPVAALVGAAGVGSPVAVVIGAAFVAINTRAFVYGRAMYVGVSILSSEVGVHWRLVILVLLWIMYFGLLVQQVLII